MLHEPRDHDTLGGRLLRAREAANYSESAFARIIGIRKETLTSWESDRSEPRANKLVTIAGLLGVSPAWLLHGVGESPVEGLSGELQLLRNQMKRIRELQEQTTLALQNMERAIDNMERRSTEL